MMKYTKFEKCPSCGRELFVQNRSCVGCGYPYFKKTSQLKSNRRNYDEPNYRLACPKCGSTYIVANPKESNGMWGYIGVSKPKSKCNKCGHIWSMDE